MTVADTAHWFTNAVTGAIRPDLDEIRSRLSPELLAIHEPATWQQRFTHVASVAGIAGPAELTKDGFAVVLVAHGLNNMAVRLEASVDDKGHITAVTEKQLGHENLAFTVTATSSLDSTLHADIHNLFAGCYRNPNHAYLDRSLAALSHIATCHHDTNLVGFALGETRTIDLPRLPATTVCLAGLSCVDADHRRKGLFARLANAALAAGTPAEHGAHLSSGRMAHPASLRSLALAPSVVPKADRSPTKWQQETGACIAAAYGVTRFDPETFVCIGDGTPIGEPVIDLDVRDNEWQLFQPVDRDRGDSLLAIAWLPTAPSGW